MSGSWVNGQFQHFLMFHSAARDDNDFMLLMVCDGADVAGDDGHVKHQLSLLWSTDPEATEFWCFFFSFITVQIQLLQTKPNF